MPRGEFQRFKEGVLGGEHFVTQNAAMKKGGIISLVRLVLSLHILSYRRKCEKANQVYGVSLTLARESLYAFVREIIVTLGEECLRAPTEDDVKRILGIN